MQSEKMRLMTPGKVNLLLQILEPRGDGYHGIRSIIVPVSLYDAVSLETTTGEMETTVARRLIPDGDFSNMEKTHNNLATKAARVFKETTGRSEGVRIHIEKSIPVCAGLGGGSADAAAVIVGLNMLWDTRIPGNELMAMGARVGSDVPALIHGGPVYVEGIGELVSPVAMSPRAASEGWWMVLANPGFGSPTRDVYLRHTSSLTPNRAACKEMVDALEEGVLQSVARLMVNDLQATVFRKYPLVGLLARELERAGAVGVLMCGSGSSLFALACDETHARDIENSARQSLGPWLWTRVARMLPDGVMVAHGPLEARV